MAGFEVVWTVLPNGIAGMGEVRLCVLVTPRLKAPVSRLDQVGEFVDWPRTLRETVLPHLRVRWGSAAPVTTRLDPRSPAADSALWQALFPGDTKVDLGQGVTVAAADTPGLTLRSFPTRTVHEQVGSFYREVGEVVVGDRLGGEGAQASTDRRGFDRPWRVPSAHQVRLTPTAKGTATFTKNRDDTYQQLGGFFSPMTPSPPSIPLTQAADLSALAEQLAPRTLNRANPAYPRELTRFSLGEAYRFYDRFSAADALDAAAPTAPPDLEFHGACGFLADYPELLRRFGLAFDLVVPVPAGTAQTGTVRVEFADLGAPYSTEELRPLTVYRYVAGAVFTSATSATSEIRDGWLGLAGNRWMVSDLDVDSAMLKAVQVVDGFDKVNSVPADDQMGGGLAALQGAGLTVFCADRDALLADRMGKDAAHRLNPAGAVPRLDGDHLARGYRVDVAVVSESGAIGEWRSLCRRRGTYTIRRPGSAPLPIPGIADDEGAVRSSSVTHDPVTHTDLYVHEALFGWDGWSLVAPMPGRTLDDAGQPVPPNPPVGKDFPLDTKFTPVPGSLPALRYGKTYRFRARVVDLAGNSLEPGDATPDYALSTPVTFSRWEPVLPPTLVETKPYNEGESARCLVIRSTVEDDGTPVSTRIWALRRADTPGHNDDPEPADGLSRRYLDHEERQIAPPKSSLQMAERHGVFDQAMGPDLPDGDRKQYFKAASREAGTFLDTVVVHADDPDFSTDLKFFDQIHVAKHDATDRTPPTQLPVPRGAGLNPGEYVVHTRDPILLPYLPDVLAHGVTFEGLPGERVHQRSFYDEFRPPPWPDARPFRLLVEEGQDGPSWNSVTRTLTAYLPKAEQRTVQVSCHFAADELPLFRVWQLLTASDYWQQLTDEQRRILTEETIAGLNWLLTPYIELRLVHAVEKPLIAPTLRELSFARQPEETFALLNGGLLHSHPKSSIQVEFDASWEEWVDDPAELAPRRIGGHAHVGAKDLEPYDETDTPLERLLGEVRHSFGDTRHRNVVYTPTAVSRFREYFHPSITERRDLVTRLGEPSAGPSGHGWPVPASRRPEPPAPAYLVPTFRWSRTADRDAGKVVSARDGSGVRVYLNRPWFSSGDDELLAVVLDPGTGTSLPERLATRWGTDPVWSDTTALPTPALAHFPNPTAAATGLRLAETTGIRRLTGNVAAYQPDFDAAKRLWFCDIDLDPGAPGRDTAYFPYVRLALARYQPHALKDLELSKVVQAEFAQPVPRRTLTVTHTPAHGLRITLTGPAAANGLGSIATAHRVTATVEARGSISDEDIDWRPTPLRLDLTPQGAGAVTTWSGEIPATAVDIIPSYRLLVEAFERYETDPGTADLTLPVSGRQVPVGQRLTHADTIPLRARTDHLEIDFFHLDTPLGDS